MKVKSSMIRAVTFNRDKKSLRVTFHNGSQYRYDDVPTKIARRVMENKSKGRAFHRNVRDRFPTTKVRDGE